MMTETLKPKLARQTPSLFIATLAICILSLALPLMTLQVYDRILPNPGSGTLPVLIAAVCVAVILETGLRLARSYLITWNGALFDHQASCNAIDRILWSDMARLGHDAKKKNGTGEHLNRLSGISRMKDFESGYMQVTIFELLMIPLYLGLIAYVAGALVVIPLTVMIVFALYAWHTGRKLRDALSARDDADDRRYNFLMETLEGVHTVKSFNLEDAFCRRYEFLEKISTGTNHRVTTEAAAGFNAGSAFSHIMLALVITCGALMVLSGQITSGVLIAAILLSGRVMQPVQRALSLWVRYQDYCIARDRLDEINKLPQISDSTTTVEPDIAGELSLHNVGFRFSGEHPMLFEDVSLNLRAGEAVRITGAYGSGKSTLLSLIAAIYQPEEGEILVDGLNPHLYPHGTLGRHIGLLQTEGRVFRGTIRDNITLFGVIPEHQAQAATKLLNMDREIAKLPRGFDTLLDGLDTHQISPGLQQRIAMARVIAAQPRILLFDNADRNLDRNGYRAIYKMLNYLKPTTALVIVSDDINFVRLADRHYRLSKDGLERLGTAAHTQEQHTEGQV